MKDETLKNEKELAKIKLKLEQAKKNLRMEVLQYERETNRLYHEWNLERGRINRAEARKVFMEKQSYYGGRR